MGKKVKAPLDFEGMAMLVRSCTTAAEIELKLTAKYKSLVSDERTAIWGYKMKMSDGMQLVPEGDDACAICYMASKNQIFFAVTKTLCNQFIEIAKEMEFGELEEQGPFERATLRMPEMIINMDVRNRESDVPMFSLEFQERELSLDDFQKAFINAPDDRLVKVPCPASLSNPVTFEEMFNLSVNMPDMNALTAVKMPWTEIHRRLEDVADNHVEELVFAKGMKLVEIIDNQWELEDEDGCYFYYGQHAGVWNYHFGFGKKIFDRILATAKSEGFDNETLECTIGQEDGRELQDLYISKKIDGIMYNMHYIDNQKGVVDVRFSYVDKNFM